MIILPSILHSTLVSNLLPYGAKFCGHIMFAEFPVYLIYRKPLIREIGVVNPQKKCILKIQHYVVMHYQHSTTSMYVPSSPRPCR